MHLCVSRPMDLPIKSKICSALLMIFFLIAFPISSANAYRSQHRRALIASSTIVQVVPEIELNEIVIQHQSEREIYIQHQAKPTDKSSLQKYAASEIDEVFGSNHIPSFEWIIQKESSWSVNTDHPGKSSAYGLAGFLDGTWNSSYNGTKGCFKSDDHYHQIDCAIKYIKQRYGNPENALNHHILKGWY